MAISFISAASANAASVTLGTHALGDLLIAAVFRHDSNTQPTKVAGWYPIQIPAGSGTNVLGVYAKFAASAAETSGTWTNATQIIVAAYRSANFMFGGRSVISVFSTSAVVYGTASGHTGNTINGRYIGIAGIRAIDTDIEVAPTGMTARTSVVGGASGELALHDTNGEVDGWAQTTYTLTTGSSFAGKAVVFEIIDSGVAIPAGSGGAPIISLGTSIIRGES